MSDEPTRSGGITFRASRTHARLVQDGAVIIDVPLAEATDLAAKLLRWAGNPPSVSGGAS